MSNAKKQETKQGRKAACRAKGMGTIQKHGRTWRAVWRVDGKIFTKSTGTADKREAEKKLAEFVAPYRLKAESAKEAKAAKEAGLGGLGATSKALADAAKEKRTAAGRLSVTIAKAWTAFNESLTREVVSKSTARTYEGRWKAFASWMENAHPGAMGLADVDDDIAQAFMREVRNGYSPKTANDYRALLSMVWKVLDKAAGLDGFNPWNDIKPLPKETHVRRELTVEELTRVVAALDGEMRVLFAIGIYTGLRLGDCVNLDWGAVDLARGFIQWTPHKTKKHGTVVKIPLFPALAAILAETPARQRRGLILPYLAEEYRKRNTRFSERVRRVFEDADIITQSETERGRKAVDVGFHSLRHSFVSLAANAGVPLHVVQAIVGHSNAAMTQHYFHVSDDALRGAVKVLPDVFVTHPLLPESGGEAHDATPDETTVLASEADTIEAVPSKVARVARMLAGCSDELLAKAEKMLAKWLAREREK